MVQDSSTAGNLLLCQDKFLISGLLLVFDTSSFETNPCFCWQIYTLHFFLNWIIQVYVWTKQKIHLPVKTYWLLKLIQNSNQSWIKCENQEGSSQEIVHACGKLISCKSHKLW